MKKSFLFIYVFSTLLFLVAVYFTLNGGMTLPSGKGSYRHLTSLSRWPAWLLCFFPIFTAASIGAKFDMSLPIKDSLRKPLFTAFQTIALVSALIAGFYATRI